LAGHVTVSNLVYQGESIDSLQADVDATETSLRLRNAAAVRGNLRGQFDGMVALHQWKPEASSLIDGTGSVRGAALRDLAALVSTKALPASGTVNATARINGTIGEPVAAANVVVTGGDFEGEPFDRFTGHVNYSDRTLELTEGQVAAGAKSAR